MSSIDDIVREIADETARDAARDEVDSLGLVDEDRAVEIAEEAAQEHARSEGPDLYAINEHLGSVARNSDCSDGDPFRLAVLRVVGRAMGLADELDDRELVNASRAVEGAKGLAVGAAREKTHDRPVGDGRWASSGLAAWASEAQCSLTLPVPDLSLPEGTSLNPERWTARTRSMVERVAAATEGWPYPVGIDVSSPMGRDSLAERRAALLTPKLDPIFIPVPMVEYLDDLGSLHWPTGREGQATLPVGCAPWEGPLRTYHQVGREYRVHGVLCLSRWLPTAATRHRANPDIREWSVQGLPEMATGRVLDAETRVLAAPAWRRAELRYLFERIFDGEHGWHATLRQSLVEAVWNLHGALIPYRPSDNTSPWSGDLCATPSQGNWSNAGPLRAMVAESLRDQLTDMSRANLVPRVDWSTLDSMGRLSVHRPGWPADCTGWPEAWVGQAPQTV